MPQESPLQPVTPELTRQAKNILRTARFGALASLEPDTGYPLASRISCTTDMDGAPVFLISSLAPHYTALEANKKCSLLLGEPGKGDPLAHPRITITGAARKITDEAQRAQIRFRFLGKHPKAELYIDFQDFAFWRLEVQRASFNGGFAKACEFRKSELLTDMTGCEDLIAYEKDAVAHMNEDHRDAIQLYATKLLDQPEANWKLASLDMEGMDLAAGDTIQRYWFTPPLKTKDELRPRLVELVKEARNK